MSKPSTSSYNDSGVEVSELGRPLRLMDAIYKKSADAYRESDETKLPNMSDDGQSDGYASQHCVCARACVFESCSPPHSLGRLFR